MTVTATGWTVDQTSYRLLCAAVRDTVHAGLGANDEIGSIRYRASAVLYLLLLEHPIDRWGRCRSCRRSGTIIGLRRRPCRIYLKASYWLLRLPDEAMLLSHLADELGLRTAPGAGTAQPPTSFSGSLVITGGMPWPR